MLDTVKHVDITVPAWVEMTDDLIAADVADLLNCQPEQVTVMRGMASIELVTEIGDTGSCYFTEGQSTTSVGWWDDVARGALLAAIGVSS